MSIVEGNEVASSEEDAVSLEELTSALKKSLGNSQLEIVNFSAKKLSFSGENFCSNLTKVNVTIRMNENAEDESLNLLMKKPNSVKAFVEWSVVFKKEVFTYTDLIPAYQNFERESGIKESEIIDIVPRYFGHQNSRNENVDVVDEDSFLLMEDLNFRGYYVCDRLTGLDFDHAKAALVIGSRYHALSLAMKQKRPKYFEEIVKQNQARGVDIGQMKSFYGKLYETLKNQTQIQRHFAKIAPCFSAHRSKENQWFGLAHGDFRLNNILFHKDTAGNIDDVKLIDFQIQGYESILRDLIFFCTASLDDETLENRMDDLLDFYYDSLMEWLNRLGCDVELFSRVSYEKELKEAALQQFTHSVGATKFFVNRLVVETKNACEYIDAVMQSECTEAYVKRVLMLIDIYDRKAWF